MWKTLCSHSMEPLSSIKPSQFTLLSLSSVFNLYSNLRAAQRKGDLRLTSYKSPQIFRSFYQQMVWLLFRSTSLRPRMLGIFTLAAQEEILSWLLSHSRSSPINYSVVNPIGTELCQTRTLLITGAWKEGLNYSNFFLSHNYCLFGIAGKVNLYYCLTHVLDGWNLALEDKCYCHDDTFICVQVNNKENWWYILRVVCFTLVTVTHWGFPARCPLSKAAASGRALLVGHVYTFWNESMRSDWGGPTCHQCACRFLSASCWNETRCCVQPVWTDEITHELRRKRASESSPRWGLLALSPVWSGQKERSEKWRARFYRAFSIKRFFVFNQNQISHSFRSIYQHSLIGLSVQLIGLEAQQKGRERRMREHKTKKSKDR